MPGDAYSLSNNSKNGWAIISIWKQRQPVCTSSPGCGAGKISRYSCVLASKPAFGLGFAAWSQAQIEQGLARLASAVKRLKQRGAGNGSSFQIHPVPHVTSPYWPSTD